jgi:hypothetical protein
MLSTIGKQQYFECLFNLSSLKRSSSDSSSSDDEGFQSLEDLPMDDSASLESDSDGDSSEKCSENKDDDVS